MDDVCTSASRPCLCSHLGTEAAGERCNVGNRPASEQPTYILRSHVAVTLPATNEHTRHRVIIEGEPIKVGAFDVIALQFKGRMSPIVCEENLESPWRQNIIVMETQRWNKQLSELDVANATWLDNHLCHISAVYTLPQEITLPENIAHMPYATEGVYTYTVTVTNSFGQAILEKNVDLLEEIKGFDIVEPSVNQDGYILLEAGDANMLFIIEDGNYVRLESEDNMYNGRFHPFCPSMFPDHSICSSIKASEQFSTLTLQLEATHPSTNFTVLPLIATNTAFNQTMSLNLLVQEKITGLKFAAVTPPVKEDTESEFVFKLTTGSHMTFTWTESCGLRNGTLSDSVLFMTFTQPGICSFEVKAENLLSTQSEVFDIMVCTNTIASELSINVQAVVEINADIPILAVVNLNQFSCLLVVYDFGDGSPIYARHEEVTGGIGVKLLTMHIFNSTGYKSISVTLLDALDNSTLLFAATQILVNQRIEEVAIVTDLNPLATETEHTFTAVTTSGSGTTYYEFDFGDDSVIAGTKMSVVHIFYEVGTYVVQVTVSNNISEVSSTLSIRALEPVIGLELKKIPPTLLGKAVIFTATVTTGTEVQFQYHINTEEQAIQTTGVLQHTFSELGDYNITVEAFNSVSKQSANFIFYVVDSKTLDILPFDNELCVEVSVASTWTANMIHFSPSVLFYEWDFGDRITLSETGTVTVQHIYNTVQRFNLKVTVSDNFGNETSAIAEVCVQERITGFTANHNGPIALQNGNVVSVELSATVAMGTDVQYKWEFKDGDEHITQQGEYEFLTSQANTYKVEVTAFNDVSSEQKTFDVRVCEIISDLEIQDSGPEGFFAIGDTRIFQASVTAGSHLQYSWAVNGTEIGTELMMLYTFNTTATYVVSLTIRNPVGSESLQLTLSGQEPVTEVKISASSLAVHVNDPINFTVTYETGSDVEYLWKICNTCNSIQGSKDYTNAFKASGVFEIQATVLNKVSSVSVSVRITILVPITDVKVAVTDIVESQYVAKDSPVTVSYKVNDDTMIASQEWKIVNASGDMLESFTSAAFAYTFRRIGSYFIQVEVSNPLDTLASMLNVQVLEEIADVNFVYSGKTDLTTGHSPVVLTGTVGQGSKVTFSWKITSLKRQQVIRMATGNTIEIQFPNVGEYIVTVIASNALGSKNNSINFGMYENVGAVVIEAIDVDTFPYLPAYESVWWQAHSNASENEKTEYKWEFRDSTPASMSDIRSPVHAFNSVGKFTVTVTVRNPISTADAEQEVIVQETVKELLINLTSSQVTPGKTAYFQASINQGTNVVYEWAVANATDLLAFSNASRMFSFQFNNTGPHTTKVTAKNYVSKETQEVSITVEEPVEGLVIRECCDYTFSFGHLVTLTASVERGTNVAYNWTVMDTLKVGYTGAQIKHMFSRAGGYVVGVTGTNALTSEALWIKVSVENPLERVQIASDNSLVLLQEGMYVNFFAMVSGEGPQQELQYTWYLNDEKLDDLFTQNVTLNFTQGQKVLEVYVSNNVSSVSDSISFMVYYLHCDSPKLTPAGGTKRTELKSRSVEFEIGVEACIWHVLHHDWKVYRGTCREPLAGEVTLPDDITVTTPVLVLPAQALDYGQYCVVFTSSFSVNPESSSISVDLSIVPSLLQAIIDGGSTRTLAKADSVVLDGRQSYDPDLPRDGDQELEYAWSCVAKVHSM